MNKQPTHTSKVRCLGTWRRHKYYKTTLNPPGTVPRVQYDYTDLCVRCKAGVSFQEAPGPTTLLRRAKKGFARFTKALGAAARSVRELGSAAETHYVLGD